MNTKQIYDKCIEVCIAKKSKGILDSIKRLEKLEKLIKTLNGYCNIHLEIDDYNEYGVRANIVLEPNAEMRKEVEEIISKRKADGPHIYFNSGDDWRKYLQTKKELNVLELSCDWATYYGYEYDKVNKRVIIPMYECRAIDWR